jgi:hypothetical protein
MDSLNDSVGEVNIYNSTRLYSFVQDRFCSPNKAIDINPGQYLQIPAGIYFSGDFTISAWIYLKSYNLHANNILIFGKSWPYQYYSDDSIIFKILNDQISIIVYNLSIASNLTATFIIQLNQWYHVTATLKDTTASLYVNGVLIKSGACFKPNAVTRGGNNIGLYGRIIVDDFKIYQGALTANDVFNDYNVGLFNGTLFNSCPTPTTSTTTTTASVNSIPARYFSQNGNNF